MRQQVARLNVVVGMMLASRMEELRGSTFAPDSMHACVTRSNGQLSFQKNERDGTSMMLWLTMSSLARAVQLIKTGCTPLELSTRVPDLLPTCSVRLGRSRSPWSFRGWTVLYCCRRTSRVPTAYANINS